MTAVEVENFQEIFVFMNAATLELSLALALALSLFIALLWLFTPGDVDNANSEP